MKMMKMMNEDVVDDGMMMKLAACDNAAESSSMSCDDVVHVTLTT
jgi:hypothetical protein